MSKVLLCNFKGRDGYKYGEDGYCCTFIDTKKSRKMAYDRVLKVAEYKARQK